MAACLSKLVTRALFLLLSGLCGHCSGAFVCWSFAAHLCFGSQTLKRPKRRERVCPGLLAFCAGWSARISWGGPLGWTVGSMPSPYPPCLVCVQWMKADEVEKSSSGMPIRIENPNQFVPLYTDPQEVLDMRNKVRQELIVSQLVSLRRLGRGFQRMLLTSQHPRCLSQERNYHLLAMFQGWC